MIEALTVVTSSRLVDRSGFNPSDLANFERVTGIRTTRRWDGTATELAARALTEYGHHNLYGREVGAIDALIVVTQSPDRKSPCMAAELHDFIGLPRSVPAFDMNQSCDGFVYGLDVAARFGRSLLVCVDMLRAQEGSLESLLFSDAASVAVVQGDVGHGTPQYLTNGAMADSLCADDAGYLRMDGAKVFDFVTRQIPEFIHLYPHDADVLCQHQANLSMMKLVEKRSGFQDRALCSIEKWGNMSLCSIPAALAEQEAHILGRHVLLCGYGAGFCAAQMTVHWSITPVANIVEV